MDTSLKGRISADFIKAMKAGQKDVKMTLSMLKTAITEGEKKEGKELTDAEVLAIIQKYDKSLDQTLLGLTQGGKGDSELAATTRAEKELIATYLPAQMTEDEIRKEVELIFGGSFDRSNKGKATGLAMKHFQLHYAGNYNSAVLKGIVDEVLASDKFLP